MLRVDRSSFARERNQNTGIARRPYRATVTFAVAERWCGGGSVSLACPRPIAPQARQPRQSRSETAADCFFLTPVGRSDTQRCEQKKCEEKQCGRKR